MEAAQRNLVALWLLGLLNNSVFVILIAGAKSIASGGVGLVYLCNTFPTLVVQGTGPYWFHLVSYRARITACALMFCTSVLVVASSDVLWIQLLGVGVGSFAQGMGESSVLALTSFYGRRGVTAWSSGTGAAGIFGYTWKAFFTDWLGFSFSQALVFASALPAAYYVVYVTMLRMPGKLADEEEDEDSERAAAWAVTGENGEWVAHDDDAGGQRAIRDEDEDDVAVEEGQRRWVRSFASGEDEVPLQDHANSVEEDTRELSVWGKLEVFRSLWPFTIPLGLVYVSEYSMQSGTWAAIGFPIDSEDARSEFYLYSNWLYQVGVFFSRSSGNCVKVGMAALWVMPVLQCLLLVFFILDPLYRWWWDKSLLVLCLLVGCLGGAVYVHTFCVMERTLPKRHKEFSMASVSVAATGGTALSNALGLIIQGCLYGAQGITDGGKPPTFTCGYKY